MEQIWDFQSYWNVLLAYTSSECPHQVHLADAGLRPKMLSKDMVDIVILWSTLDWISTS